MEERPATGSAAAAAADSGAEPSGERSTGYREVRLAAEGLRFVNGVAMGYCSEYPAAELEGVVSEKDFAEVLRQVNDTMATFWPCNACFIGGYACTPCTLGLSLLCPSICISEGEQHLVRHLNYINHNREFLDRGVEWSLEKTCLNSCIVLRFPAEPPGGA